MTFSASALAVACPPVSLALPMSTSALPSMQGRMAITLAIDHRPDLILLDLNLPDISGLDVLRALKKDMRTQHIPVIMVSADPSASSQELARQSGALRYLAKPLEVVEFMRTLGETWANSGLPAGVSSKSTGQQGRQHEMEDVS
jgi:CheY-like chemotaxis protein